MIMYDLTRVWRVENAEGIGPYRAQSGLYDDFERLDFYVPFTGNPPERPSPSDDGGLRHFFGNLSRGEQAKWSCGFSGMPQYFSWFAGDEVRDAMSKHGFMLNSYVIESCFVRTGKTQILFRKPYATLTDHLDCNPYQKPSTCAVLQYKRA